MDLPRRERFVRIAYNESLRLSRLVEGMFEISLLDMRDAGAEPEIGSLPQAMAAAHDACAESATARQVGIVLADVPPVQLAIDTDRLTMVLVNLIDNAVKHGGRGGGVFVGVEVTDRRFVRITIDDDGPGIASADRERVSRSANGRHRRGRHRDRTRARAADDRTRGRPRRPLRIAARRCAVRADARAGVAVRRGGRDARRGAAPV